MKKFKCNICESEKFHDFAACECYQSNKNNMTGGNVHGGMIFLWMACGVYL